MTTPDALSLIKKLSNFTVGAGTVLDLETASRCLGAGERGKAVAHARAFLA